jgi:hypothetical protein
VRREVIGGMRLDVFPCSLLSAAGIYFQACSIDHSDISPLLESMSYEQSKQIIAHARKFPHRVQRFDGVRRQASAEIVSELLMRRDHLRRFR